MHPHNRLHVGADDDPPQMSSSRRTVSIVLSLRPRRQRLQCETLSERASDALGDALHQRLWAALLGAATR